MQSFLALAAFLLPLVSAHARIKYPTPLGAPTDNSYNAPLAPDGSDFPCKNMHTHPNFSTFPVAATWTAGSTAHFEIQGHDAAPGVEGSLAAHSGGSCQASISYDNGATFKVLHSFEGGCPRGVELGSNIAADDQVFEFEIPAEAKAGEALFAWTWVAVSGNRDEFYMNCAKVEVEGSGKSVLKDLPDMFVGDLSKTGVAADGECRSTAGSALQYPEAGTEVTVEEVPGIGFAGPTEGVCALKTEGDDEESSDDGSSETPVEETPVEEPVVDTPVAKQPAAGGKNAQFVLNGLTCSVTCQ